MEIYETLSTSASSALSITVDNQNLITGDYEWAKLYGTNAEDNGYDFSIDRDGNIFITGSTYGNLNGQINNGQNDAFIIKLDSNGNELWTKLFGTSAYEESYCVKIEEDGSLFLTGFTSGNLNGQINNGDRDIFLIKLDSNGNELWTKLFGSALADTPSRMFSEEYIYLTGDTFGNLNGQTNNGGGDSFISKLDKNGNEVWTKLYGTEFHDEGFSLASDDNFIYFASAIGMDTNYGILPQHLDASISKIDSNGNVLWSKNFGENFIDDTAYDIKISDDGYIYVTGFSGSDLNGQTNNGGSDSFLMKLDKDGNEIWTKLYGTEKNEYAIQLSFRSDGYIFLTGGIQALDYSDENGFLKKLDMDGNEIWTKYYGNAYWEQYEFSYVEKEGSSIYVSGHTKGDLADKKSNGNYDAILMKFSDPITFSEKLALNYIASNPDLIGAFGINTTAAISHYQSHGASESRRLTSFSSANYLAKYSDLAAAFGGNETLALKHYIQSGYAEGRTDSVTGSGSGSGSGGVSTLTDFQALNYIASNADLIGAFGINIDAAKSHYTNNGISEGRSLTSFSASDYLSKYSDLSAAFGNNETLALKHFIQSGYAEGRTDSVTGSGSGSSSGGSSNLTDFQALNYIASYGDLINAFGTDLTSAKSHYINNGKSEGRVLDNFDEWGYLASNNELINPLGSDTTEAVKHYISFGYSQGKITNSFDAQSYLNNYADLRNAFGNDQELATKHYVEYGFNEGRVF